MTKKSGYALIALTHLAKLEDGALASAREIARQYGIPQALLMNVMKELSAADYLDSVRGARGGYCLARPADELCMLSILETLEGTVCLADCMTEDDTSDLSLCELREKCPIATPVHSLNEQMREFLRMMTLEDILEQSVV
jgi:Rrf2 family protein